MTRMFYIQDARSYVGNCPLWWGRNSAGYVTDLNKAQKYDEQRAREICSNRDTDIAWPCDYIDSIAAQIRMVDSQHMQAKCKANFNEGGNHA